MRYTRFGNEEKEHEQALNHGDEVDCDDCGKKRTKLIVVEYFLCCEECNSPIGGQYNVIETSTTTSEAFSETDGSGGGHGPAHRVGSTLCGTQIGSGGGLSQGARRQQKYENYQSAGTESKMKARDMIRTHIHSYPGIKKTAEELLVQVAWPSKERDSTPQFRLVWQATHPWGVPGTAAACIHAAYILHGIQPDRELLLSLFDDWGRNPPSNPIKILNKAKRAMAKRMGPVFSELALNRTKKAQKIIDTLVLRNPHLRPIHSRLYLMATRIAADRRNFPDNIINPIGCLVWLVGKKYDASQASIGSPELNITMSQVEKMLSFAGCSTAFRIWAGKIMDNILNVDDGM